MTCEKKFKDELKARGFRFTPQREVILEALHELKGGTTTAEALHERVRAADPGAGNRTADSPRIDLVTIYRTLELLAGMGFAKCIATGHKGRLWEFLGSEQAHPHLLCRACGELSGFDEDEMAALSEHLRVQYGFAAALAQLTIPGLCRRCRAQAEGVE